jgi:hypothetical protein
MSYRNTSDNTETAEPKKRQSRKIIKKSPNIVETKYNIGAIIKFQSLYRGFLVRKKINPMRYIHYYYETHLKKYGVKKLSGTCSFSYALQYLYLNMKKQVYIEDIKNYVESKGIKFSGGDPLQIRHLSTQKGYNVFGNKDNYKNTKIQRGYFLLNNLYRASVKFFAEKRNDIIDDDNWKIILTLYENMCVNCGSKEGEPMRWNKNQTTKLQQGHMDPRKGLTIDNVIPQCGFCNQQYLNKAIFNNRGFVIEYKKSGFN